jgi:hypothetical protein
LDFFDKAVELKPEAASLSGKPCTFASIADVLAGESSADGVNGNSICPESFNRECFDIFINRNLRPVLVQHGTAKRFDFAKGNGLKTASSFKPKRKPTNAAKKIENVKHAVFPGMRVGAVEKGKTTAPGP